jgi:hypothetical protein
LLVSVWTGRIEFANVLTVPYKAMVEGEMFVWKHMARLAAEVQRGWHF